MRNSIVLASAVLMCFASTSYGYKIQPKIVDGLKAAPGQFPFYAFLEVRFGDPTKGAACGASIISDEWVLTAAHCLMGATSVGVHMGEYDLRQKKPQHIGMLVESDEFIIHPNYMQSMALHDIALLRLPMKIPTSKYITPVSLPTNCTVPRNDAVVAIGHGAVSDRNRDSGDIPMRLQYAPMRTISSDECLDVFPDIVDFEDLYVCATDANNAYTSVCSGDSGGPLVTVSDNTLIGVADFVVGAGCETGSPQGFTSVHAHLKWIARATGLDLSQC